MYSYNIQITNHPLQLGIVDLPENDPSNRFGYEIIVSTGAMPGSGTTSRVSIALEGSTGNSGPRYLVDSRHSPFKRGDVNSFLVTTNDELGIIDWIRYAFSFSTLNK